jgi:hypothetical protein
MADCCDCQVSRDAELERTSVAHCRWAVTLYHQASGRAPCNVEHGRCPAYAETLGQGLTARSIWRERGVIECTSNSVHAFTDVRCTAKMEPFCSQAEVRGLVNMACAVRDASRVHADSRRVLLRVITAHWVHDGQTAVSNNSGTVSGWRLPCIRSKQINAHQTDEYVKQDRRSVALADTSYCMGIAACGQRPTCGRSRQPVTCYAGAVPSQGRNSALDDGSPMRRAGRQRLTAARLLHTSS